MSDARNGDREGRVFPCPHCNQRIFALSTDKGKVAQCPLCEKPFLIDQTLRTVPVIEGVTERRAHDRFGVRDGIVQLPWGPFKQMQENAVLEDLSVGGLRCRFTGFAEDLKTFEMLRHLLRKRAEVQVSIDLPAFTEDLNLKGILRQVKYNKGKQALTLCIQFVDIPAAILSKLERLETNPIIRGIHRTIVS